MENEIRVKMAVLDTNVLINVFKEAGMTFKDILKALNTIFPEKKIEKILILDSVYSEVESKKKGNDKVATICRVIYSKIWTAIKNGEFVEYSDVARHENGVDESLIDYCVANDQLLITSDTRLNAKYAYRAKKNIYNEINIAQIKKVIKLHEKLDTLTSKNLYIYLQNMFDYRVITTIEYIQASKEERFSILVNFIIDDTLRGEEEKFISKIKQAVAENKEGEIDSSLLNKSLIRLKGYDFGHLKIEVESLKDKFKVVIKRFLEEKNFSSFEELEKCNPFKKEEELVRGILRYYKIGEEDGNEKN